MIFRGSLMVCATLLAGAVVAQTATPGRTTQSDRWDAVPAPASSSTYRAARSLPGGETTGHSPFHFKHPANHGPAYAPPPEANDKAAVMGKPRPWQNGRPPVDCAVDPRDPSCH
jgi:hypothetical protein